MNDRTVLDDLLEKVAITEERTAQLELDRKRLVVNHSLLLHRDSASARDVLAMIQHLIDAGMPLDATLKVDGTANHTRVYTHWSTEPNETPALAEVEPPA